MFSGRDLPQWSNCPYVGICPVIRAVSMGSTQHLLEAHAQGFEQLRIVRER